MQSQENAWKLFAIMKPEVLALVGNDSNYYNYAQCHNILLYNSVELPSQAAVAAEVNATLTNTFTANQQKACSTFPCLSNPCLIAESLRDDQKKLAS